MLPPALPMHLTEKAFRDNLSPPPSLSSSLPFEEPVVKPVPDAIVRPKNAGFKPIGQTNPSVKRFFPDDEDEEGSPPRRITAQPLSPYKSRHRTQERPRPMEESRPEEESRPQDEKRYWMGRQSVENVSPAEPSRLREEPLRFTGREATKSRSEEASHPRDDRSQQGPLRFSGREPLENLRPQEASRSGEGLRPEQRYYRGRQSLEDIHPGEASRNEDTPPQQEKRYWSGRRTPEDVRPDEGSRFMEMSRPQEPVRYWAGRQPPDDGRRRYINNLDDVPRNFRPRYDEVSPKLLPAKDEQLSEMPRHIVRSRPQQDDLQTSMDLDPPARMQNNAPGSEYEYRPTQDTRAEGAYAQDVSHPPSPLRHGEDLYEILTQVGEGTFGKVYKARNTGNGRYVALKRIRMEAERDGFPVTAMREIKLLQSLRHENIIRLYEMMVSEGKSDSTFTLNIC